jgi:indolepyruvate decarboxylase
MLRVFEPEAKFNDLSDWHYADIARSLGGAGPRVKLRSELAVALEQAWHEKGKFHIVEVMLDRGETSDSLQRFVAGLNHRKNS